MGEKRYRKSDRRSKDSRYHYSKRDKRRYDDDNDDDDDYRRDYKHRDRYDSKKSDRDKPSIIERILTTSGQAANNTIKASATGIIAGATVALIGIYAIFGKSFAGMDYLPLATIGAGALSTTAVWFFGRSKTDDMYVDEVRQLTAQIEDMQDEMDDLNERLSNVEMIESLERRLAERDVEKQVQGNAVIQSELPNPLTENKSSLDEPTEISTSSHMPSASE